MKFKKTISIISYQKIFVILMSTLFFTNGMTGNANSAGDIVTIQWKTNNREVTFFPSSKLLPDKRIPENYIKELAQKDCDRYFNFTGVGISGASGTLYGTYTLKSKKRTVQTTGSGWRQNEQEFDEFYINYSCSGSYSVLLNGKPKSYIFSLKMKAVTWSGGKVIRTFNVNVLSSQEFLTSELKKCKFKLFLDIYLDEMGSFANGDEEGNWSLGDCTYQ